MRIVVVLPAPLGPRKPKTSPLLHLERERMHGGEVAVGSRELLEFDHAPQCMLRRRRGSMQNNKNELAPWEKADLPEPPMPRGLSWIGVCGPGVIVLGVSIGSGEFLLGPATFVKHGLSLLWVTLVAVFFQTVFNTELMRYTVATGEPVVTGFMRTRPGKTFWAWFYAVLYFLQIGWPAWAATAAGAIFFLFADRLAAPPADSATIYLIGIATFLACVAVLLVGKRIARTLEILNWVLVACILGSFLVLGVIFVPAGTWLSAAGRFRGFRYRARRVQLPARQSRHPAARRAGGIFGRRRRAQPHAVELGARQGLWHGQPRGAHRGRGGWRKGAARRHRVSCSSRTRQTSRAGAAGGASCASTSGASSSSAPC